MEGRRPGVFLDRDGTIIEDRHYLRSPDEVSLLPRAAEAIAELNRAGLPVVVVTNQSGIGRGLISDADYRAVERRLGELLDRAGANVLATYHCPHSPDRAPPCDCRKPAPGLFARAAAEHGLDLSRSFFVGDRARDLEAGLAAGGHAFLIAPGGRAHPDPPPGATRVEDLRGAVAQMLARLPAKP